MEKQKPCSSENIVEEVNNNGKSSEFIDSKPTIHLPEWSVEPVLRNQQVKFIVTKNNTHVNTYMIAKKRVHIFGRDQATSDHVLANPSISRTHAAVFHDGNGGIYLMDLMSRHGTYLGKKKLVPHEPTLLHEGEVVLFGQSIRSYILTDVPVDSLSSRVKSNTTSWFKTKLRAPILGSKFPTKADILKHMKRKKHNPIAIDIIGCVVNTKHPVDIHIIQELVKRTKQLQLEEQNDCIDILLEKLHSHSSQTQQNVLMTIESLLKQDIGIDYVEENIGSVTQLAQLKQEKNQVRSLARKILHYIAEYRMNSSISIQGDNISNATNKDDYTENAYIAPSLTDLQTRQRVLSNEGRKLLYESTVINKEHKKDEVIQDNQPSTISPKRSLKMYETSQTYSQSFHKDSLSASITIQKEDMNSSIQQERPSFSDETHVNHQHMRIQKMEDPYHFSVINAHENISTDSIINNEKTSTFSDPSIRSERRRRRRRERSEREVSSDRSECSRVDDSSPQAVRNLSPSYSYPSHSQENYSNNVIKVSQVDSPVNDIPSSGFTFISSHENNRSSGDNYGFEFISSTKNNYPLIKKMIPDTFLMDQPIFNPCDFEGLWGSTKECEEWCCDLNNILDPNELKDLLQSKRMKCLASGRVGSIEKMFYYAQQASNHTLFMIEINLTSSIGQLTTYFKWSEQQLLYDNGHQIFIKFFKEIMEPYLKIDLKDENETEEFEPFVRLYDSLRDDPYLDPNSFEQMWTEANILTSFSCDLQYIPLAEEVENALRNGKFSCLASGAVEAVTKFYFFAQTYSPEVTFLIEINIDGLSRKLLCTSKYFSPTGISRWDKMSTIQQNQNEMIHYLTHLFESLNK